VKTEDDAVRMLRETGCDAVMLGRAAFGDPWVFRRVRALAERGERVPPPSADERLEAGLHHLRLMSASVGPEQAAREMRKHVAWYVKGLPHSARVREQVNRTRTVEEMAGLLHAYRAELERLGPTAFEDPAARPALDEVAADATL
jgi:tRNA-dihydrouridine synthase